jgi:putative transposase
MSAKGNCYDNACTESFIRSLKVECFHCERFISRVQTQEAVLEYNEIDYNASASSHYAVHISLEAYEARMSA